MDKMKKKVRRLYVEKLTDYAVSFYTRRGYGYRQAYNLYQRKLISKHEAVTYAQGCYRVLEVLADLLCRDLYHDLARWIETQAFATHLQARANKQVRKYEDGKDNFYYLTLLDHL